VTKEETTALAVAETNKEAEEGSRTIVSAGKICPCSGMGTSHESNIEYRLFSVLCSLFFVVGSLFSCFCFLQLYTVVVLV
jgi:hypothetical protein